MSINRVFITGNLTRDPEMRQTNGGMPIMGFGMAVNERRKNQQTGEWEDYPNYVDCTMFGERAAKVSQYLAKGSKVSVDGRLRYSSWEKDGQKRSKLEVVVDNIEFMSRSEGAQAPTGLNYGPMPPAPQNVVQAPPQVQSMVNQAFNSATPFNSPYPGGNYPQQQAASPEVWDEDIPFD